MNAPMPDEADARRILADYYSFTDHGGMEG